MTCERVEPVGLNDPVHAVVPAGIDDPARPSGGNTYDRRLLDGLVGLGCTVREHRVPGRWPRPVPADLDGLARQLAAVPDGAPVLLDGLIASAAPAVLVPESARLRLVVLVHMPLGPGGDLVVAAGERRVLRGCAAVIATSRWTRDLLVGRYGLDAGLITVAEPGTDPARPAAGSPAAGSPAGGAPAGGALLCVGVLAPHKGQDVLVDALARLTDLDWSCTLAGALDVDPGFADLVRRRSDRLGDRIRLTGPLVGRDLDAAYHAADLLVLPSRAETFGLVVGEALARAIPVVAGDVGGVPDALGADPLGDRPGLLVGPGDVDALAGALRRWLTDAGLRRRLRRSAALRRGTLDRWSVTVRRVAAVLVDATGSAAAPRGAAGSGVAGSGEGSGVAR